MRRGRVTDYRVPVRWAAPQAIGLASALGWLYGKAIKGDNGAIRYGWPAIGTRSHFTGYAYPPQLFIGYNPRNVAAGAIRPDPASLPGDSIAPATGASPTTRALAGISISQMGPGL